MVKGKLVFICPNMSEVFLPIACFTFLNLYFEIYTIDCDMA